MDVKLKALQLIIPELYGLVNSENIFFAFQKVLFLWKSDRCLIHLVIDATNGLSGVKLVNNLILKSMWRFWFFAKFLFRKFFRFEYITFSYSKAQPSEIWSTNQQKCREPASWLKKYVRILLIFSNFSLIPIGK